MPAVAELKPVVSLDHDSAALAATYDQASDAQFDHGKSLVAGLALREGEHVLDVGAGTGRLAAHVADLVGPQGTVTAVDPLPLRVALAEAKGKPNLRTAVTRAEDLSAFADRSFDAVYLNSVFHWVSDKPKALAEAFRVLKPGGRLGLNTQDPTKPHQSRVYVQQALRQSAVVAHPAAAHPSLGITAADLEALVTFAGFVDWRADLRTLVDHLPDVDRLIEWSIASSFGNFLAGIGEAERRTFRDLLERIVEPHRTARGIRLERYLVFAYATKP